MQPWKRLATLQKIISELPFAESLLNGAGRKFEHSGTFTIYQSILISWFVTVEKIEKKTHTLKSKSVPALVAVMENERPGMGVIMMPSPPWSGEMWQPRVPMSDAEG